MLKHLVYRLLLKLLCLHYALGFFVIEGTLVRIKVKRYFTGASYWNWIQIIPMALISTKISRHLASRNAAL
jgi:hypothetical protein